MVFIAMFSRLMIGGNRCKDGKIRPKTLILLFPPYKGEKAPAETSKQADFQLSSNGQWINCPKKRPPPRLSPVGEGEKRITCWVFRMTVGQAPPDDSQRDRMQQTAINLAIKTPSPLLKYPSPRPSPSRGEGD